MSFSITFLGTGTSIGIPVPGCACPVCHSDDPRNQRFRCSILLQSQGQNILIDTAPEFRLQALKVKIARLEAVFWTHAHADHLHGIDDLRALSWAKAIPGYASPETVETIRSRFTYLWKGTQVRGGKARIDLQAVSANQHVAVGPLRMIPIPVMHGRMPIYGWRCGPLAYITDASEIPAESYSLLRGLEVLILGALRFEEHPTHFTIDRALGEIKKIGPKRAYLTHLCHEVSHQDVLKVMPSDVEPARDGLCVMSA